MDVRFVVRNADMPDNIRDYTEKKLDKLERFFDRIIDTQVTVTFKRGMYVVEITSNVNGIVMRGEDYAHDLRKAFDKALKNIERQVKRHKEYLGDRAHMKNRDVTFDLDIDPFPPSDDFAEEVGEPDIVKVKKFPVRTMNAAEAARQMDLLGHSFFLFQNGDTGTFNVVYRRKEGGYGLLEPI